MSPTFSPETRRRGEEELLAAAASNPAARDLLQRLLHARLSGADTPDADRAGATAAAPAVADAVLAPPPAAPSVVPPPRPASVHEQTPRAPEPAASLTFSFIFFAGSAGRDAAEKYDLLHDIARFGDEHGFEAVWIPERHFHPFGGIYSSPVVMAASLSRVTRHIRLRAGSVVLPLHHPVTVCESWAMVDQLSAGRVDLAFASGWNPNDFVVSPDTFPHLREVWLERIETVRRLWRGDAVSLPNGTGELYPIAIFPRPVQPELPVWLTVTSRDDSFVEAGRKGYNVLTMLKGISLEELGRKIALYREARAAAGHDRAGGIVSLMLHTLVHPDAGWVRSRTAESFGEYIKSGLSGHVQAVGAGERPDAAATQKIVEYAAERYSQRAALFGTPDECRAMAESVRAIGVNEIALLMDFGVDADSVKESLPHLLDVTRAFQAGATTRTPHVSGAAGTATAAAVWAPPSVPASTPEFAPAVSPVSAPVSPATPPAPQFAIPPSSPLLPSSASAASLTSAGPQDAAEPARVVGEPIAVIGMGGRFPGSPDLDAFWAHLRDGHELISDIPPDRWDAGPVGVHRAGLLDQIDRFDPSPFRITNREASTMDPHQRLFLEAAWEALRAAGCSVESLAGSRTGVFAAAYNADFTVRAATGNVPLDAYTATGTSLFMVANRVSHVFDLRGPSEVVNTACSSALVALHRAVRALRSGECELAVAGGVSLLLSMGRLAGLDQYGILSHEGRCRPFDEQTSGQVIGEGAGALVLKTLRAALRDGDAIDGVIRGSAVNHHGNRSGSPTLPDVHAQAEVVMEACRDAGLSFDALDYIEAHGTGGFGDIVELEAFKRADTLTRANGGAARAMASCPVGTLKPNIGFLEAAGGMSQAIKVLLMLRHQTIAPTLNHERCPEEVELDRSSFHIATHARAWRPRPGADGRPLPLRASVHAYGLGGTNAHVVLEEAPSHAKRTGPRARVLGTAASASTESTRERVATTVAAGDNRATAPPWTRELRIAPESPIAADHQVRGRGVVPAVTYLDLAAETCRPHLPPGRWRFENVFWIAPCVIDAEARALRCTARATSDDGTGAFFQIAALRADGGAELLATGHALAGRVARPPSAVLLDEEAALRQTIGLRVEEEIYRASSVLPVRYGPAFRAIKSARVAPEVVVATLQRPDGEAPDAVLSRGLIEGAFQAARLLGDGEPGADVFMPFSVDTIELLDAAIPARCRAIVTPSATGAHEPGAGRFDAALVADGRPWAIVRNFCARRERPAAAGTDSGAETQTVTAVSAIALLHDLGKHSDDVQDYYRRHFGAHREASPRDAHSPPDSPATLGGPTVDPEGLLADLAAGRLTVDDVERLLAASAAAVSAAPSADEALLEALRSIFIQSGRLSPLDRIDQRAREDGALAVILPSGTLVVTPADLAGLVEARLDPSVLTLDGRLRFDLADDLFARDVGDALSRHYNVRHCERAPAGALVTEIYRSGSVVAASGERRAIYPWAVPAAVGQALAALIRSRRCSRTLEVGMAYGLATLFICAAHRDAGGGRHIAIDPHQRLDFLGIGLLNVERAGLATLLEFIEAEDVRALPELERRGDRFDLVFIDGLHMFDYTLLDFFYADRLLSVGGCIAFDDAQAPGVRRALDFIAQNRSYRAIDVGVERLVVLEKLEDDARSLVNPNHFRPF